MMSFNGRPIVLKIPRKSDRKSFKFFQMMEFNFIRRISKARFQKFFKTNRNLSSDKTFAFSEYSSHLGIAQMNLALLSLLEYFCDFRDFCVRLSYYSLD